MPLVEKLPIGNAPIIGRRMAPWAFLIADSQLVSIRQSARHPGTAWLGTEPPFPARRLNDGFRREPTLPPSTAAIFRLTEVRRGGIAGCNPEIEKTDLASVRALQASASSTRSQETVLAAIAACGAAIAPIGTPGAWVGRQSIAPSGSSSPLSDENGRCKRGSACATPAEPRHLAEDPCPC